MSGQIADTPAVRSTARTEIQSNLLADRLERFIIQSKPYVPWIIGLILAGILIATLIATIASQAAKREASGWTEIYFSQMQPDQLELVAADFQGTNAAMWAAQANADAKLNRGLSQIYLDRSVASQLLKEARELYQKVLTDARDPLLVARATLGVAKTYDGDANTELATKEYSKVLNLPGAHEQLRESVTERLKFLQSDEGKEFYAWFKANAPADPRPLDTAEDLKALPDLPDLKFETPSKTTEIAPTDPAPDLPKDDATSIENSSIKLPPEGALEVEPAADSAEAATPTPETDGIQIPPAAE